MNNKPGWHWLKYNDIKKYRLKSLMLKMQLTTINKWQTDCCLRNASHLVCDHAVSQFHRSPAETPVLLLAANIILDHVL